MLGNCANGKPNTLLAIRTDVLVSCSLCLNRWISANFRGCFFISSSIFFGLR